MLILQLEFRFFAFCQHSAVKFLQLLNSCYNYHAVFEDTRRFRAKQLVFLLETASCVYLQVQTRRDNYKKYVGPPYNRTKIYATVYVAGLQQLSIDICCPRPNSAANPPAAVAAVD